MKFRIKHLVWIIPSALAVAIVLASWLGNRWLESSGGRQLIERELSRSMGMEVRLDGDYRLKFFPHLAVAGENLAIARDARPGEPSGAIVASVENYAAAIAWRPFFSGELQIVSVNLAGGFLDTRQITNGDDSAADGAAFALPPVKSLVVEDIRVLVVDENAWLQVVRLDMSGIAPGKASETVIEAHWVSAGSAPVTLEFTGTVTLETSLLVTVIESLSVTAADIVLSDINGMVEFGFTDRAFQLVLNYARQTNANTSTNTSTVTNEPAESRTSGNQTTKSTVTIQGSGELGDQKTGEFDLTYQQNPEVGEMALHLVLAQRAAGFELSNLKLVTEQGSVAGSGCILQGVDSTTGNSGKPELHLQLRSEVLDFDAMADLVPAAQEGAPSADIQSWLAIELPMDIAATLEVQRALMAGAVANGLTVRVGAEPTCAMVTDTTMNSLPDSDDDPSGESPGESPGESGRRNQHTE